MWEAFRSSSRQPGETLEEYQDRKKALEDIQKFQDVYRRSVDGHNCQLSDTKQGGRILGHGVQMLVGPKVFEALAKVVRLRGGAQAAELAVSLEEEASAAKELQAASKAATGEQLGETFAAAQSGKNIAGAGVMSEEVAAEALQAEEAARRAATGAAKTGELTVQFGKDSNQMYHTFRHTDMLGLNRTVVKSAIETHLTKISSQIAPGKPVNQIIEVAGQRIQYTAFKFEDGTIHIGRIHGVK